MNHKQLYQHIVVGLIATSFLAIIVWLVRSESQQTRESIRVAAKDAGAEMRKGIIGDVAQSLDKNAIKPGKTIRDAKDKLPTDAVGEDNRRTKDKDLIKLPRKDAGGGQNESHRISSKSKIEIIMTPYDHEESEHTADTTTQDSSTISDESATSNSSKENPAKDTAPCSESSRKSTAENKPSEHKPSPDDVIGQLFELGQDAVKSVDAIGQEALGLSLEEEKKVGRQIYGIIRRDWKLLQDKYVAERLQRLAKPILEQCVRKKLRYTISIVDNPEVNAFAHLGGYVYIHKGLLDAFRTDAEIQFFLAHEIAHVDLKHAVRRTTYSTRAAKLAGEPGRTTAQIAYQAIAVGYFKDDEFEADAWAARAMIRIGRDHEEVLSPLSQLLTEERKKAVRSTDPRPVCQHGHEPNSAGRRKRPDRLRSGAVPFDRTGREWHSVVLEERLSGIPCCP